MYGHLNELVTATHVPVVVVHMILMLAQKDLATIVSRMRSDNTYVGTANARMDDCVTAVGQLAEQCTDEDAMRLLVRIHRVVWDAQLNLLWATRRA